MDEGKPAHEAIIRLRLGPAAASARVRTSTSGLIAISGLVSSILLSTAALVWVATAVPRARPTLAALRRR
jgi:hypothetical protein